MGQLVLLRHGQSQWNLENRFTGWIDVPLSAKGREEAIAAGKELAHYRFDRAFTSRLVRAIETLSIVLAVIEQKQTPIEENQALNERMYGDLQGLNKDETAKRYGEHLVLRWRRSYDARPPGGESLQDTAARVLPYYERKIQPYVLAGQTVIVVAHGNSLRALVMHLDHLSGEQVSDLHIPTGSQILYQLDEVGNVVARASV